MLKNYYAVINQSSGTAKKKYDAIKDRLDKNRTFLIDDPKNFSAVYDKILSKKIDTVLLAGGDGTLIRGIEYLDKKGFKGSYGLLPLGTANYLARNLDIPLEPGGALDVVEEHDARPVPIAAVNGEYFALMMTIGLSRMLSERISNQLKQTFGQFAYIIEMIRQSKHSKPFEYSIESPDLMNDIKGKSRQLIVYNSDLNQQVKIVPDHDLEKPTVKLVTTQTGSGVWRLYAALLMHVVSLGRIRRYIKVYELHQLSITTDPVEKSDLDGEVSGEGPFDINAAATKVLIHHP